MPTTLPQQVVNDAIKSFREGKIDEQLPVELKAKETLIKLTKTKSKEELNAIKENFETLNKKLD